MTSRLARWVVLLVAATAVAEDKPYTIAELEQLVAQSAWLEAAHLKPIAVHPFPTQPTLQLAVGRKETSHGLSH